MSEISIKSGFNWDLSVDCSEVLAFFFGFSLSTVIYLSFFEKWVSIARIDFQYQSRKMGLLKQIFLEFFPRILFSYVYIRLILYFNIKSWQQHFQLGIWVWLTQVVTANMPPILWERKTIDYLYFTCSEKLLAIIFGLVFRQIYLD